MVSFLFRRNPKGRWIWSPSANILADHITLSYLCIKIFHKCFYCGRFLVRMGHRRKNGAARRDWISRKGHVQCFRQRQIVVLPPDPNQYDIWATLSSIFINIWADISIKRGSYNNNKHTAMVNLYQFRKNSHSINSRHNYSKISSPLHRPQRNRQSLTLPMPSGTYKTQSINFSMTEPSPNERLSNQIASSMSFSSNSAVSDVLNSPFE
jgi:hypothetical protein